MPAPLNRVEPQMPAALRQSKSAFLAVPRPADAAGEKASKLVADAPVGSIAAIESRLGF